MERPTGVTLISVLYFIGGGVLVLGAVFLLVGFGALGMSTTSRSGMGMLMGLGAVGAVVCLIFAGLAIAVGWGLWTQREWARIVAIVLAGLSLLLAVPGLLALFALHMGMVSLFFALIRIAINVLIIWYLLQPEVRQAFVRA